MNAHGHYKSYRLHCSTSNFFCIGQSTGRLYMATSMNPQNYISGGFRILANYFWLDSEVWKELCLFLHMYILHILFSSAL